MDMTQRVLPKVTSSSKYIKRGRKHEFISALIRAYADMYIPDIEQGKQTPLVTTNCIAKIFQALYDFPRQSTYSDAQLPAQRNWPSFSLTEHRFFIILFLFFISQTRPSW